MYKIVNALFSGKLINKSINSVIKCVVKFVQIIIKKLDRILALLARWICCIFTPIKNNKIVFMTYSNNYECNPKYIAEEIIKRQLPCELVWIVPAKGSMLKTNFPEQIRRVRRGSYHAFREIASAKVWIDNSINFLWDGGVIKKKGQIYIETWHGSMGIKRVGKNDVKSKRWRRTAQKSGMITTYCISNSEFENNVYRSTYWNNTQVLMYGHARNDYLFDSEKANAARANLIEYYGLSEDDKFILYAPTFRESNSNTCYDINYEELVSAMSTRFGGNWKVLLRLHFHDRKKNVKRALLPECVVNVTSYLDMQNLLMASDAGITDYSSWAYDYVLTRKPLFIFATDIEEYNTERGLYYPLETTPFPIATCNSQLIDNVSAFDDKEYQFKIDSFLHDKGCVEDGHASERVVDKIVEIMEQ